MFTKFNAYKNRENGFTLIELLIVVLIIGILAAIAIPVYLGIQDQSHKSVLRSDVNQSVKRVQVALTEGVSLASVKTNYLTYTQNSDGSAKGETVTVTDSSTAGAAQFNVNGTMAKASGASIDYTYAYDSATGKFSENGSDIVLGGGSGTSNTVPVITTSSLPSGVVGTSYNQSITATGTPTPTSYAKSSGTLPPGVSFNTSTGVLSGTPTTGGSYTFGLTATNTTGTSAERTYTVVINDAPTITTTSLPTAVAGSPNYSATVSATSNPAATWAMTGLPTGLTYDTSSGVISGAPTTAGSYTVHVTATNTYGSRSADLPLTISANLLTNAGFDSGSYSTSPWTDGGGTGIAAHLSSENMTCPANNNAVIKGQNNSTGYLLMYSGNTGAYATLLQDVSTTITTGKTYAGGMYVAGCSNASQTGTLYIVEFNGSTQVGLASTPYSVGSGWNYVNYTYTATGPGTTIRLQFVPTSGQGNILFDNANLGVTN